MAGTLLSSTVGAHQNEEEVLTTATSATVFAGDTSKSSSSRSSRDGGDKMEAAAQGDMSDQCMPMATNKIYMKTTGSIPTESKLG
jgi:hypothetical protein